MHAGQPRLCPHCARPLQAVRFGVAFGPLAARIIDAIETTGARGITGTELAAATYGDAGSASIFRLRTYVSAINRILSQHGSAASIRGNRRVYRIILRAGP